MDIIKTPKSAKIFICEKCDFKCSKQSDWNRHIVRPKHLENTKEYNKEPKNAINECNTCGKIYKYYSGLWKHKNKCVIKVKPDIEKEGKNMIDLLISENKDFKNIILELVKNNGDLQKQMLEVCKKININTEI